MRVKIIDDTFKSNKTVRITKAMRDAAIAKGHPLPYGLTYLQIYNRARQRVQRVRKEIFWFEDKHLENVVRRARRWIVNRSRLGQRPPRHIALAMAAFHKAYPDEFEKALKIAES